MHQSQCSKETQSDYPLSVQQKLLGIIITLPFILLIISFIFSSINQLIENVSISEDWLYSLKLVYWYFYNHVVEQPVYYFGIPILFVMQWQWPADESQPQFGAATRTDFLYSLWMIPFYALVTPEYHLYFKELARNFVPLFETNLVTDLPLIWQLLIGYLAIDFMGWFHHLVRHKVPFFWAFHAVHHSQRNLNPFSNERLHLIDWCIANIIKFIPAYFFTESLGIVLNYIVIHKFLDHLNHSNVKTNLGLLRYIFVTPQSHRVHHSCERAYFDRNFGVSLSVWDHIFGTQCRNYHIYPTTGVPDKEYPYEQNSKWFQVLKSFLHQQIYPFVKIFHDLKASEMVGIKEGQADLSIGRDHRS
jgi:sterol desaturase/sphingolipid hydroxylase (fatty acid hydroxylase superfamily)